MIATRKPGETKRSGSLCAGLKSLQCLIDFLLELWHFKHYEVPL